MLLPDVLTWDVMDVVKHTLFGGGAGKPLLPESCHLLLPCDDGRAVGRGGSASEFPFLAKYVCVRL
jgi:hypothetical protein